MTESTNRKVLTWDDYYKNEKIEKMPWYNEELDFDLEEKLNAMQLHNGILLDLGTGPGTQAMHLAKKGFDVIGSDISETVIKRNKIIYENKYQNIKFVVDNILDSNFKDNYFDYVFDRGCFHVFSGEDRPKYYNQIKRILKQKGILFLKCFSIDLLIMFLVDGNSGTCREMMSALLTRSFRLLLSTALPNGSFVSVS